MKKLLLFSMMCLLAFSMQAQSVGNGDYIDLGLPSGTLWKSSNEKGFYTYDEAVSQFGNRLPTNEQWEELKTECQWERQWVGNAYGYKVTGSNGNSIMLPADGYRRCSDSTVSRVGSRGVFWSSESSRYYEGTAFCYRFVWDMSYGRFHKHQDTRCAGNSVRLVQNK